ncbi:uncharacterized protein PHACADRAFT_260689 [Phanerochaete carnosa HHB-10118-sp]|uniref:Extracellular membrane protein CFEM domain-containing protein n=1 Tax=Phanerochaete carnosa (strain HHB-10118-sp) TaxID=650164 RepID=K5W0I0_PHACS|nr:uncharacterized protein PHACADRAFT_260689 [Phanerochaete carnosa HHB-10118-sp]EKM52369.1 hypothetical protein PHACADRAFT_260689 [Phanerochaete carnosa HHB-10118-sp]
MQLFAILTALFALLAGRVLALEIAINIGDLGSIPATQFLDVSDSALQVACGSQCTSANETIAACTDDNCLCTNATMKAILQCEQCMFSTLIAENRPMPDPLAGNQILLTNYTAACLSGVNVTVPASLATLMTPDNWDGPFGQGLTPATTAITLIAALLVGGGAIAVVNTM